MSPTIVRFDPAAHSLAGFRTGADDVDDFFKPSGFLREMRKKRMGDIAVAVDNGQVVGCVAFIARSAPDQFVKRIGPELWKSKSQKPLERGTLDREFVIPAVRVVILGVVPSRRREGIGTALLDHVQSAVIVPIYYLHPSPESVPFYLQVGFEQAIVGMSSVLPMFKTVTGEITLGERM